MQMKLTVTVAAAIAAMAGLASAQDVQVVKIGSVAPMSGAQAHYGRDNANGVLMAVEDLNAKNIVIGGKKIKFEAQVEDDAADPKQGTAVAQKLCDAKVAGVVGHLNSGTTIPASKVYHDCGIPHITGAATNPDLTKPELQHDVSHHRERQRPGRRSGPVCRQYAEAEESRRDRRPHRLRAGRGRSVQEDRPRQGHEGGR